MTRLVYLFCNETFKMLNPNLQVKLLKNITFAELILIIWYFFSFVKFTIIIKPTMSIIWCYFQNVAHKTRVIFAKYTPKRQYLKWNSPQ